MSQTLGLDVAAVRAELPVTGKVAYLNTGTAGPLPRATVAAMQDEAAAELDEGRIDIAGFYAFFDRLTSLRAGLAKFVGVDADEVGLTHHTTEGMNIGVWGIDWQPGDEVVTTTLEHPGGLLPIYQLHKRQGVKVTFANCGDGEPEEVLDALRRAIHPGVRAVVLSHVSYQTGAVLPLRQIVDLAHAAGALVVVDGAQSVGAIPVSMHELGVDVYAFPGQKWLCGPEGTGGIYVARDRLAELQPTFVGGFGIDHHSFKADQIEFQAAEGAQRYEVGSLYRPAIRGLAASLSWIEGLGPIYGAIAELSTYCRARVAELPGAEVLTPEQDEPSGLVAVRLPGVDGERCLEFLSDGGVRIRSIPENGALRISCGFYNTPGEIDRTVELLREFQRG
jgi:L-cysteine/cystine lyase